MDYPVIHDEKNRRFEIRVEGAIAYLSYVPVSGGLDYEHTIVPPSLGGRGIGSFLVSHALEYARQRGLKVRPTCSFVAAYIDRHPDYQRIALADERQDRRSACD